MNGHTKFYEFDNIDDLKNQIIYTEKLTKQINNIKKNHYQLCINTDKIYDSSIDNKYEFSQDIIYNITLIIILNPKYQVFIIDKTYKYSTLLNPNRGSNYEDWINIGLLLHDVDESLLYAWEEFSNKVFAIYPKSYLNECSSLWVSFNTTTYKSLLTFQTLKQLAQRDNPKEFEKTIINCSNNTFDIACAFYTMYEKKFKTL